MADHALLGTRICVKNTFVDGYAPEAGSDEEEKRSLKRSSSDGELSKHSSKYESSESSFLFWMPPLTTSGIQSSAVSEEGRAPSSGPTERRLAEASNEQGGAIRPSSSGISPKSVPMPPPPGMFRPRMDDPAYVHSTVFPPPMALETDPLSYGGAIGSSHLPSTERISGGCNGYAAPPSRPPVAQAPLAQVTQQPVQPQRDSELVALLHEETGLPIPELEQLYSQGILQQIPRNEEGQISSVGSLKHDASCIPCIFWFRGICTKSLNCTYCHFRHPGQKSKRQKPNKRTRMLMREARQTEQAALDPAQATAEDLDAFED